MPAGVASAVVVRCRTERPDVTRRLDRLMGLVAWILLGYVVLLLCAGLVAGALCRIAKLSAGQGQTARGEVVLWGRIPLVADRAAVRLYSSSRR